MKDSTTDFTGTARLSNGDEVSITPSGWTVTGGTYPTGTYWTVPASTTATVAGVPYILRTTTGTTTVVSETRGEEYFQPPNCGKCRQEVTMVQSFVEQGTLIMVFFCHGEKRRVDISLKRFKNNEQDAKNYLIEQIDWLFCDEEDWRELTPKKVLTPNADRDAIRKWLTA
jgi:hypothetical protein